MRYLGALTSNDPHPSYLRPAQVYDASRRSSDTLARSSNLEPKHLVHAVLLHIHPSGKHFSTSICAFTIRACACALMWNVLPRLTLRLPTSATSPSGPARAGSSIRVLASRTESRASSSPRRERSRSEVVSSPSHWLAAELEVDGWGPLAPGCGEGDVGGVANVGAR